MRQRTAEEVARDCIEESLKHDQQYGSRGDFMRSVMVPIIQEALKSFAHEAVEKERKRRGVAR